MGRSCALALAAGWLVLWATPEARAQELVARASVHDTAEAVLEAVVAAGTAAGAAAPREDRHDDPPSGLYAALGVGTGAGSVTLSEEEVTELETYLDWGDLHFVELGLESTPVRFGFSWTSWAERGDRGSARMNQFDVLLTAISEGGLFLKAGIGVGTVEDARLAGGEETYVGVSGRLGVGWEALRLGPVRLGVESGLTGVSYDPGGEDEELTVELSVVLLALTASWGSRR